ncbi:MAG TPA: glucosaminidase domain-containing protein [Spirochaetota bacterium]|nr:glucosaminidase domain-containing protein [Spirochaetota bacterium]HOM38396.1 glucosaminidase domain-containing protein [Spirochaetota bacterium]HPQ48386.1 glucosaminidase domain-containing protein [Spirochaetota bacterium]
MMVKNFIIIKFLLFSFILYSCTSVDRRKYYIKESKKGEEITQFKKDIVSIPVNIMGQGVLPADLMAKYITMKNNNVDYDYALYLANIYIEEANREGINYDIAFAQMCLETGYLSFGNQVEPGQNNFAGIGAVDGGARGNSFPSPRIGIRAQIQHLKAYASYDDLSETVVDPRFKYVKRGIAPTIYDLAGKWASDLYYGEKIEKILKELYNLNLNNYYLNK